MKTACVLLVDGFEETEAVTVIDVLRRAEITVEVLGVERRRCTGAHAIVLEADAVLADREGARFDAVILPGGMPGAATLRDHAAVQQLVRSQARGTGILGAICAGPIALGAAGILEGKRATCYPGFEAQLRGARLEHAPVVRDGNIITSRGVGTALAFSLALVEALRDPRTAEQVGAHMLVA